MLLQEEKEALLPAPTTLGHAKSQKTCMNYKNFKQMTSKLQAKIQAKLQGNGIVHDDAQLRHVSLLHRVFRHLVLLHHAQHRTGRQLSQRDRLRAHQEGKHQHILRLTHVLLQREIGQQHRQTVSKGGLSDGFSNMLSNGLSTTDELRGGCWKRCSLFFFPAISGGAQLFWRGTRRGDFGRGTLDADAATFLATRAATYIYKLTFP